jgi:hypothetical protein
MPEVKETVLKLDDHTVNAINQTIGRHNIEEARLKKGVATPAQVAASAVSWFSNIGALLSKYLPDFLEVAAQIAAKGVVTMPTIAEFFAEGNLIFNGTGKPAPAPVVAPTPAPAPAK